MIHTHGRTSKGCAEPKLFLRAATVVGMSWIDAVFISTKVSMLSEAVSDGQRFFSSLIACSPSGVAAFPSPSRFALIFIEIKRNASDSGSTSGYSRLSSGAHSRESLSISPQSFAIRIKPDHMHSMPQIDSSSVTASPAQVITASPSASAEPLKKENTTETAIMIPNTYDISRTPPTTNDSGEKSSLLLQSLQSPLGLRQSHKERQKGFAILRELSPQVTEGSSSRTVLITRGLPQPAVSRRLSQTRKASGFAMTLLL